MQTTIDLNLEDIKLLLAKEFQADPKNVFIMLDKVYMGYSMEEHLNPDIRIRIIK